MPFSLRFHPTGEFEFPDEYSPDNYYLDQLQTIPEGEVLYQVYGLDAPFELGGKEHFIGNLKTTSAIVSSNWGDDHLFFRHQWCEDDIKVKPEWGPYYPKFVLAESFANVRCPFSYLWNWN